MEARGDLPCQKARAVVPPIAEDFGRQQENARWDSISDDERDDDDENDDRNSWRAEFDAAASKSSSQKRWKEERRIRQQEKRSISNYLRSIDLDARFVAQFCKQPKCVVDVLLRLLDLIAYIVIAGGAGWPGV